MIGTRLRRGAIAVSAGLVRSIAFAGCAMIIPALVAMVPVLAAFHLLGSPWSWSNPWSWAGLVLITVPVLLALAHPIAQLFRRLIIRWQGIHLDPGYRNQPEPVRLSTGYWWNGTSYERSREDAVRDQRMRRVLDPAYGREVRWVVIAAVVIAPVCSFCVAALGAAVVGFAVGSPASITIGVVLVIVGAGAAPFGWRIVTPLAQRWLAPADEVSTAAELRSQRADLSAAHDAEIRRIERDLHDGAQARLVAVGLDLAAAERLVRSDPAAAEAMLRSAKDGTRASLDELRELVHGVYPSVLIERGLVPAIRAAALDSPLAVTVDGPDDLKLPSPVAAALYFAVSEAFANAAKHAAGSEVTVTVTSGAQAVDVVVRDTGPGGAVLRPGGGLDGVRRRLGVFDATLDLHSPAGGPTTIRMQMPCALF